MTITALTNIGTIVSGDIHHPIIEGDTIIVQDGVIEAAGTVDILESYQVDVWIDVQGATVIPGLIDSHTHPVLGDYTPRQNSFNFLEGSVHGGVTSIISAGEVHTPGRPTDPAGVKALAVLTHKSFTKFRPKGIKVHAGALILEKGLVEEDFKELADEGLWLVGEVGLGSIKEAHDAVPMVEWAKKYGMKVAMHTGGISIPGSSIVTAEMVMNVSPTLSSHTNGGPTAISIEEIDKLIDESDMPLEIVQCGNMKAADHIARSLKEKGQLDRLILGTDAPSGSGVMPLGMLRTIVQTAALSDIPGEQVIACATGNTAKVFELNTSMIAAGREADLVVIDSPIGSSGEDALSAIECGDIPAVSMVMIDGEVRVNKSRNTPPSARQPIYETGRALTN
ncbi:Enamidase [Siminovitchia acidinfaciens]|uniref:Enamidase n=1 Tax=Siminovitchia acidinfaciens TaxID=2321395 RepID=A0A429Y7G5_9BACI|nr:amidohydrolase family protein [Siminovitchia acidinfaciens]RST77360.1 Enamidase [Siminovitchia acidinfaciens]